MWFGEPISISVNTLGHKCYLMWGLDRLSVNSERSPSTKRALPELPATVGAVAATTSAATTSIAANSISTGDGAADDGGNLYDQLERDIPAHQIRSKTSESASVKVKTKFLLEVGFPTKCCL